MRKERKNKSVIYVAIFIAFIMITSVLGYIFGDSEESSMKYNKYNFYKKNLKWVTKISNAEVDFDYFPAEIDNINLSKEIVESIKNSRMIYITYSPNQTDTDEFGYSQFELTNKLMLLNIYAGNGMTESNEFNLPIISCANATQFVPVIVLEKGVENTIKSENNCIILKGEPLRLKDRLLYGIFGVI